MALRCRIRSLFPVLALWFTTAVAMEPDEQLRMREVVREMFYHVYGGYKEYAFPHDELRPLTRTHTDSLVELGAATPTRDNYHGVALTLIDSLDTLAILGDADEFAWAVRYIGENVTFNQDAEVSLFETNIRVLGGLLSAHLIASGTLRGAAHLAVRGYRGDLLRLAVDVGDRLLSAFDGCAKLPRSFVSLRGGSPRHNAKREQCTAGVGTLLLEFGTLSRLTLDDRYEDAALCALRLLWSKRSKRGLLGNTLDVKSGSWRNPSAGIGAGIDSFYEYALKSYLVFGSAELYSIWNVSYAAPSMLLPQPPQDAGAAHRPSTPAQYTDPAPGPGT
jgi:mannosidase alpha-like ER degradation enhancer 1